MTKEERIKEAYEAQGFSWMKAKEYVDESGWSKHRIGNCKELTNKSCGVSWRPDELYGLDNNNGWIKIEIESDLPSDICYCWVIRKNETEIRFCKWSNVCTEYHSYYQIIKEPQLPIY